MPSIRQRVRRFVEGHDLPVAGEPVLVGVSGGVDSMLCAVLLREMGAEVHVLHVNYGLRPAADGDAAFVESWCAAQSPPIPCSVIHCDPAARAEAKGASLQAVARAQRYAAFAEAAVEAGCTAVATGHHRDDQAETLLLNLLYGSGPEGLAGMPPSRPLEAAPDIPLIRPLLPLRRAEIEAEARRRGLDWRTDASNQDPTYRRNAIRAEVLPLLEHHVPGAAENIARTADLMRDYVEQTLDPELQRRMTEAYTPCANGGRLALAALRAAPDVWQRRMLLAAVDRALPDAPHTSAVAEELVALVPAQVGARVDFGAGTVWRERGVLRLVRADAAPEPLPPTPVPWGADVEVPGGTLCVERTEAPETLDAGTARIAYADADRLGDALTVRSWQDGDRLQPLGLDGTKSVSDLLTDRRVPPHRRESVPILQAGTGSDAAIAWVVGHRLDHRFRVRPETSTYAKLTFRPREKASDGC